MYAELQRRLYLIGIFLGAVIVIGTVGYKLLGGDSWSVLDSLYMTIITITTVGFGETHPLEHNDAGRVFTIFLALFGMGILLYGMGNISAFIIEGDLKNLMWRRRVMKKARKLRHHFIVCGLGEIGVHIVEEFIKIKLPFVVIEKDIEQIGKFLNSEKIPIIHGDATDDETLLAAGIERADGLVAAFHSDKDNLFLTVSARQLNPSIRIVSHAIDPATQKKIKKSGADAVVSTNVIGALRMVSELVRPNVVNFLDQMLRFKDKTIRIEEVMIRRASDLIGKNMVQANIGKRTGVLVIAMRNIETNQFSYSFTEKVILKQGDILVVIGAVDQVQALKRIAGYDESEIQYSIEELNDLDQTHE